VGVVFQDNRLFPHLTVRNNLEFGYRRLPRAVRRLHPDEVIGLLRLEDLLERGVDTLSGGEARRVAIGRALLASPRLLLLDEPLTGLDADLRRALLTYLLELPRRLDIPLVYVSHTLADFLVLVQKALVIRAGVVEEVDAPDRLLDRDTEAGEEPLESWLEGTALDGSDPGYVRIQIGGQVLTAPGDRVAPGAVVRVAVPAHDVMLVVGPAPRASARTVLTATVRELHPSGRRVVVALDLGQPLFADLTPAAVRELDLAPGRSVHVLLKARGLRVLPGPGI
jgi:molybdate transport system ATP-binding protein